MVSVRVLHCILSAKVTPPVDALLIVIELNDWPLEVTDCAEDPLSKSVEDPAVMEPLVRLTLPATDQVFDPIKIDGTPLEDLEKLILPVTVIAGLLAEQSRVSLPAPVVWTDRLPLIVRLFDTVTVWPEPVVFFRVRL